MTISNPHDKLKKLARSLTLSSKVYSDALSQLTRHTASIDTVSQAVTKQLDIERKLFGSMSTTLEQINRAMAFSPSIQSLSATNPLTHFVEDDVRAALSFVDALNSGTHVIESKLTTAQLSSIVSRMESLLVFLLCYVPPIRYQFKGIYSHVNETTC